MLIKLSIKNYALIEDVEIDFKQGLTVITGETGAGKSILLGALSLILGKRADRSMFKDQSKKCIIEGYFSLKGYGLNQFFESNELDYDEESIIRREINAQGKSRIFINDTPAKLDVVKQLGETLLDIHSQNQSNLINEAQFQFDFIDSISNSKELLLSYQEVFGNYKRTKKELEELQIRISEENRERDYLQFQFDELSALNLNLGEEQELEEEQKLLAGGEDLILASNEINNLLIEQDFNVIDNLNQVASLLARLKDINKTFSELSERLNSSLIELEDIQREVSDFSNSFEFDPNRLQYLDERLNNIHRQKQKHLVSNADELIAVQEDLDARLDNIASFDEQVVALEKQLAAVQGQLERSAKVLSNSRIKALKGVGELITKEVQFIEIPNAVFQIEHQFAEDYTVNGLDRFQFLFSANKGIKPAIVSKTASGGEVSRLMLCLKNCLAKHKSLPTILFDEIDTGVSGEVANKMGDILQNLGKQRQVIAITHLPQIASKGTNHLYVYKEDTANKTVSKIKEITGKEQVEEIAKMLSGKNITEASINNALELINNN